MFYYLPNLFTINPTRCVAHHTQAKWIIFSSLMFLIPSFMAYMKNQYLMSIVLFLLTIMSINHWRNPTYSWRRIADHVLAKISFIIFFVSAFLFANNPVIFICETIFFGLFLYCYYMSDKYCNINIELHNTDEYKHTYKNNASQLK